MFGKYKTPIFLIIFSFLIQFLGNPVPRHEPPKIANTPFDYLLLIIAIHRKFQTRRVAEDSTRLYGEAAQHRMRLSVDGYSEPKNRKPPHCPLPLWGRVG